MNPAIEIKNLSFSYGDTENQLKHINLSVEKGEVIVLTGPSGSGKSTLTRVINGLIPYFFTGELSGEVWLFGKNTAEIPSWERGKYVGNVFQDPRSQFFANEVAGEIAFGCENYGVPHDEIVKRVQDAAEASPHSMGLMIYWIPARSMAFGSVSFASSFMLRPSGNRAQTVGFAL